MKPTICPNCGAEVQQTEGKRKKEFCNSTCRSNVWQKEKRRVKNDSVVDEHPVWTEPESVGFFGSKENGVKLKGKSLVVSKKSIEIQEQIDEIEMEKIPSHITTPLGKKSWKFDQQKRIEELKKQL